MKYYRSTVLATCSLFVLLSTACNQSEPPGTTKLKTVEKCFVSSYEQDTAVLNLKFTGRKVEGEMQIRYADGKRYDGTLKGQAKSDTLILAYDFKINNIDKWYRNPVALLTRADSLIMGVGQINVVWGTGAFDKSVPIDYEHARFVFVKKDCIK